VRNLAALIRLELGGTLEAHEAAALCEIFESRGETAPRVLRQMALGEVEP
jgi:hypothetical protein